MSWRGILREPLLHFLLLGALLFAGIAAAKAAQRPVVRIDAREIEQLAAFWALQAGRPPTRAELSAMIQERVEEELLAREAIRLGLDEDDMIVRRRLAQKMAFASQDVADVGEPDEAALRALYERTKVAYAAPPRLALRHLFFSRDRAGEPPEAAAAAALARLRRGEPVAGDPSVLPLTYADASIEDLARDYDPAFAHSAARAPVGAWSGPVASPYGVHLLRVEARRAAQTAPFAEVRDAVRDAWIAERRAAKNLAFLAELRRRYRVEVTDLPP